MSQYRRSLETDFAISVARTLIQAKILNQYRVVQRLELNHPLGLADRLEELGAYAPRALVAPDLATLRGIEGVSTALYFRLWSAFLPEAFPFERRTAHPPLNPVNAAISFAATLIYQELRALLHLSGLDGALGCFHQPQNDRYSLALDLMEPFRPAVAEALVLRLFNLGLLQSGDFEPSHDGIYLNAKGRKAFLQQYEQRLTKEFSSEHAGHRTTLRQQLLASVTGFKNALTTPSDFRAFRLN